jgi:hypothetical protein
VGMRCVGTQAGLASYPVDRNGQADGKPHLRERSLAAAPRPRGTRLLACDGLVRPRQWEKRPNAPIEPKPRGDVLGASLDRVRRNYGTATDYVADERRAAPGGAAADGRRRDSGARPGERRRGRKLNRRGERPTPRDAAVPEAVSPVTPALCRREVARRAGRGVHLRSSAFAVSAHSATQSVPPFAVRSAVATPPVAQSVWRGALPAWTHAGP